ncbi:General negative regulator of transcription C16C9.04c like [Heracleum sosnowskyi]|uniref:General negative regulator of transcription C16C9.04c like n=1 Tax=Heracleum sosnowskyi TaxID=360622 RepID=A0AAD8J5L3_9APIA|nr:General negative regulator of transcription C16C9.04c like [Heracleum sosnowskyi]
MMTIEEGKRCPLCAEEMDFTDQQLKPCKCGYQVCVWCWHQIMDMAEKDGTEGRCPACRAHYDKDKIVGMEANFERVEANANRKHKPPKGKSKTNEGRKDLSVVRVIQRKMAYVIGLPLSLTDVDRLKRKEFFGQYGKICKISLSRTASGAIHQFVNDSCSVYVTFSKEEEAVQCIQSVHGFVLEGRFLRASFGTAKYCHAWLRNMPCNNSTCLYLHSLGAEEDTFGKDEVAAVHTRSRVQQIVGVAQNLHRRAGNVLPPPIDEPYSYNSASAEKPIVKSDVKDIPRDVEIFSGHSTGLHSSQDKDEHLGAPNKGTTFVDIVGRPSSSSTERDGNVAEDRMVANLSLELSSVEIHKDSHVEAAYSDPMIQTNGFASKKDIKEPYGEPSFSCSLGSHEETLSSACIRANSGKQSDNRKQTLHAPCSILKDDKMKESRSFGLEIPLPPPSYPSKTSDFSSNHGRQHGQSCYASDYTTSLNTESNKDMNLAFTCTNSIIDGYNENRFQSSAKSDRIYRSSNSFSNEEIVEHLRRLDDDEIIGAAQDPSLDAAERSIISNIMSLSLNPADDLSNLHPSVTASFNHTDGRHGSSLNLYNNDQSIFSFGNQEGFANQIAGLESSFIDGGQDAIKFSLPHDLGESKDRYLCKPQYLASSVGVPTPGFSMALRDPPPGFLACERTDQVFHANSGSLMAKTNFFLGNYHGTPSSVNSSNTSDVEIIDQAIISVGRGNTNLGNTLNPPYGLSNLGFGTRPNHASPSSAADDEARAWLLNLLMQQSTPANQDLKYPQPYMQQAPAAHQVPRYVGQIGDHYSSWNDMSKQTGQFQQLNNTTSYTPSQQKLDYGLYSNSYQPAVDAMRFRNELGMAEIKNNEQPGFNKFCSGYGDHIFQPNSEDLRTKVFGM